MNKRRRCSGVAVIERMLHAGTLRIVRPGSSAYYLQLRMASALICRPRTTHMLTILPPGAPKPLLPSPFSRLAPLKMKESTRPAIVKTPPMMAHVLHLSAHSSTISGNHGTDDVKKWANDCRVSVWNTFIGEIS